MRRPLALLIALLLVAPLSPLACSDEAPESEEQAEAPSEDEEETEAGSGGPAESTGEALDAASGGRARHAENVGRHMDDAARKTYRGIRRTFD